jgi:predicted amidohydrolase YtcJ
VKINDSEPDLILFNGRLAVPPRAPSGLSALAIGQGHILALGADKDVLPLAGTATARIDLAGRLVVPGFVDTHIHFYEWSLKRRDLKLDDVTGLDNLLARVRRAAAASPPGQWIMGQGWNETDWSSPQMPTREALDRAAPDHPVLLWRCDLHLAAANSSALRQAGIDARTPDPPEGRIERGVRNEPTGILRELAINRVRQVVTPPDADQVVNAFTGAARALHRRGVTGIHDIRLMADEDGARAFQAFQQLDRDDRLDLRCWVTLPGNRLDDIVDLGLRTGFGNDRLRIGHVKFFCDGGMGARTAWMIEPFRDAGCGMPLMDMAALAEDVAKAEDAGLAVMIHAVGDRANRELIRMFESLANRRARFGRSALPIPHRIEHVQMIRPEDAERLRQLDLALNVTPANMLLDMNLIDAAVGEKGRWSYAFRRLMDTGAPVMFSSDCPVCDPAPLLGMHAAVTRRRIDGGPEKGWYPESRVTVQEALDAYTIVPAAVHGTNACGVIAPGKRADLAVLSADILVQPSPWLPDVRVDMTLFDGRIVHRNF